MIKREEENKREASRDDCRGLITAKVYCSINSDFPDLIRNLEEETTHAAARFAETTKKEKKGFRRETRGETSREREMSPP